MPRLSRDLPVFVYGTLRPAVAHVAAAKRLKREGRLIGPATVPGRLYMIHWYPGLVPSAEPGEVVHGELFSLPPKRGLMEMLDAYERFRPDQPKRCDFRRAECTVAGPEGAVQAWVYSYHGQVSEDRRIRSGDFIRGE